MMKMTDVLIHSSTRHTPTTAHSMKFIGRLLGLQGPGPMQRLRGNEDRRSSGQNNQRAAAMTFLRQGSMGLVSHLASTADVALANAALSTVVTCTPLALRSPNSLSSASCDILRCSAVASAAASVTALRSASDRRSQVRLLIRNGVIWNMWLVRARCFCTS